MLPIAALGAIMMPGVLFKVLAGILLVIGVGIMLLRLRTRRERLTIEARPSHRGNRRGADDDTARGWNRIDAL